MTLLSALALWWYGESPPPREITIPLNRHDEYRIERRGQIKGYRRGFRDARVCCWQITRAAMQSDQRIGWNALTCVSEALSTPFPIEKESHD